ncbi:MAG: M42 family peptidase, partial [Clostridia bacterium]|nr:M42 family peptidase [Clostridia bacterium]
MEKQPLQFLESLIQTPSPSGDELEIQKKWINYVTPFVDAVETDYSGSAIGILNPSAPFKVMLSGHCDEIAFMVTYIDDKGLIYVTKAGGINPNLALGMRVRILGKSGVLHGVVGVKAEHQGGSKGEIKVEDLYIDCGAQSSEELADRVQIGDYVIYDLDMMTLMNGRVAGRGLDNRTGAFIVAEVLRRLSEEQLAVGVYGASTVNEETNMGGAHFAACHIQPSLGIACDVTFATDYPGLDPKKDGDVKLGGGPVLSKGSMINYKINHMLET